MDRQLLARATENSDAPTPGYMYLDIAKNAAMNPATCAEVGKYLTGRLAAKRNHNVKYKCLKVISKTATSPYLKGQFKRCLAQDTEAMTAIKDALQYRGPPDPVRGDEPYERVRAAAKEALDAIYSDTPVESTGAPFATSVSSSYGPSPHQHGGGGYAPQSSYGGGGSGRRMEGIGNPMFKDPRLEPQSSAIANMTINQVMKEAKDTVVGMIKDPLARNVEVGIGGQNPPGTVPRPGGPGGSGGGYQGAQFPPGRSELMHQTNGEWTMKSNRGPEAISQPPNYANDSAYYKSRDTGNAYAWAQKGSTTSSGVGGSWGSVPSTAAQARQPAYNATPSISVTGGVVPQVSGGGTAVSDGSYEKQLVMELCPPGGMKAEPPPDKLIQFSRNVSSLNSDFVCPVLLDCLEEGQPWIIRAKALCVMEVCIQSGKKPGAMNNPYADFFHACSAEIAPLVGHSRAAIRDPAKRVLALLGVAVPVAGAVPPVAPLAAAAPPAAAPQQPVPNLLDFDETPAPAPTAPPPAAPPATPPSAAGNSLFGGLTVASAPPPQAAPPPPAAPPANVNLLGEFGGASAPAPAATQSFFGDMNVKQAPSPVAAQPTDASVAQTSSIFGNMTIKEEPKATDASAMSMPSGSAFGFINDAAAATTAAPSAAATADTAEKKENAPATQSVDTFDPLKNFTPNTAKQMMQFSPEQLQAMAYQQMMMQQQMQMAHMMAMQQQAQQKRGSGTMFMPVTGNIVMQNPAAAKTSFAFMDQPTKKEDKTFDFVRDAMSMEKKK